MMDPRTIKLPGRTKSTVEFEVTPEVQARLERGEAVNVFAEGQQSVVSYECVDCGFKTANFEQIEEHHRNQARYHKLWQRFKRWRSPTGPDVRLAE